MISEKNGTIDIDVTLTSRPSTDVTFTTTSSDLTEAGLSTTAFTFTPSNWNTPQTIRVTGVDDFIADGNITVNLVFGSIVSDDPDYTGMGAPSLEIIVLDDETYSIVISPRTLQTTEAAGASNTAVFYVAMSCQPSSNVVLPSIVSNDTGEGTVDRSSVTFTPSNWDTPQGVTVSGVDDGIEDGDQTYTISISPSESADSSYNGITFGPVMVTNLDAQASIVVTPLTMTLVEGGDNGEWGDYQDTFSVKLGSAPSGDVNIEVQSDDTNRATVNKLSLTFTTVNWNTPQIVTVTAVNNGDEDPDGPVIIDLKTATGGGYDGKDPANVTVTIEDDDGSGIRVSRMSRETREAGLQDATFKVRLSKQPLSGTTVTIPVNDTYDINNYLKREGSVNKTSLTFDETNWNIDQVVTVTPAKDYVMDGDIQYVIELLPVLSADPSYNGKKPRNVTVNNFNEDIAGFVVWVNSAPTNMGTAPQTFTGFATDDMGNLGYQYATFDLSLRSKPLSDVVLTLTKSISHDCTFNVAALTFTPSNWNVPQTVRVTGTSGGTNEGYHAYTVSFTITTADKVYGNVDATYVGKPSFSIYSSDNDADNEIAHCIKSGGNMSTTTEGGGTASFWLITKNPPASVITVGLSSSDTTEGTVPASVTITPANYNLLDTAGSNRVVVTGVDDVIFDGTIAYTVNPAESTGGLVYPIPTSYNLTNSDNETRFVTSVVGSTTEGGGTAVINVKLGALPSGDVSMSITCEDATECKEVNPTGLTFTSGNWSTNQQVTVTGEDDSIADGNVSSTVKFAVTSSDSVFNGQPLNVGVTNTDNEVARAVWVTSVNRNGEMAPGISTADAYCNGSDPNKPTGLGAATYKAMIVDGVDRIATDDGTSSTGQKNWVLTSGYHYYLRTAGTGSSITDLLFVADSNNLIPFPMQKSLSAGSYWTGMNANMTTVPIAGVVNQCSKWTLTNDETSPFDDFFGQYGIGGTVDSTAISSGSDKCTTTKRIICVQQ